MGLDFKIKHGRRSAPQTSKVPAKIPISQSTNAASIEEAVIQKAARQGDTAEFSVLPQLEEEQATEC